MQIYEPFNPSITSFQSRQLALACIYIYFFSKLANRAKTAKLPKKCRNGRQYRLDDPSHEKTVCCVGLVIVSYAKRMFIMHSHPLSQSTKSWLRRKCLCQCQPTPPVVRPTLPFPGPSLLTLKIASIVPLKLLNSSHLKRHSQMLRALRGTDLRLSI